MTREPKRGASKDVSTKTLFGVKGPAEPWSEETDRPINTPPPVSPRHATARAGSSSKTSSKGVTFLDADYPPCETSSDIAYTDQYSSPSESELSSQSDDHDEEEDEVYDTESDRLENDVLSTAQAFLSVIKDAFLSVVHDLPLDAK